jgi:hypothetical protein
MKPKKMTRLQRAKVARWMALLPEDRQATARATALMVLGVCGYANVLEMDLIRAQMTPPAKKESAA